MKICTKYLTDEINLLTEKIDLLKVQMEAYKAITENVDVGIVKGCLKSDFIIDYINPRALDMLGYTKDQYQCELDKKIESFTLPEDIETVKKNLTALNHNGHSIQFKTRAKRRNGEIIWLFGTGIAVKNNKGQKIGIFTFRDFTEWQLMEEGLSKLESLMRNIIGGVEICDYEDGFPITYISDGFTRLTGYTAEDVNDVLKNKHMALLLPEDLHWVSQEIKTQLKHQGYFDLEYRITRKDKKIVWVLARGILIESPLHKPCIQCLITDITQQKEQAQLLLQKSFELETVTNNIEAAIIRCHFDSIFTIIYANDGLFRMLGYTREQFKQECNDSLGSRVHPDDVVTMNEILAKQLSTGNTAVNVQRLIRRDGSNIWILLKGTIYRNADSLCEFHGVLSDITEQKEKEEALVISDKRYEIAMGFTDVTIFDYNLLTKQMINHWRDVEIYGLPKIMDDAVETFISSGVVAPSSKMNFRKLYEKIEDGAPCAQAVIHAINASGIENIIEIKLTAIFDNNGVPVRAVGVKKDITETLQLQREKEYGSTLASNRLSSFEANVSQDKIITYDVHWAEELGLKNITTFSGLIQTISDNFVFPDHVELFQNKLSKKHIISAFESGQRLITFEFLKKPNGDNYYWFEEIINIIKDEMTGDINIRCYITNINDTKEKELRILDEQKFYETMLSKSMAVYEVNVTKNTSLSGHENWDSLFGIKHTNNYEKMLLALCEKALHPEERYLFNSLFLRSNVLKAYAQGERELRCEYRRPDEEGSFIWVRCTMHLFEDLQTGDIKALSYVENIDDEKKKELALIYKSEHDLLTGYYNKLTVQERINAFLSSSEAKLGRHSFFIIDIDHFKSINDTFGHAFGDTILSQVSAKVNHLFREQDILGRLGGDEFVVFMKNTLHDKIVYSKAQEICNCVSETYTQNGISHCITLSIGVAIFPDHGKDYIELYQHADSALYISKDNGRNQFSIYSEHMNSIHAIEKKRNQDELPNIKTSDNRFNEYVYHILYDTSDKEAALISALKRIGMHYNVSRVYIFEKQPDGSKYVNNTFEWCNINIEPHIDNLQKIPYEKLDYFADSFNEDGIFYLHDIDEASSEVQEILKPQGIKSMLQYSILKNGEFFCMIGFDECAFIRFPSENEISELRRITDIIGTFLIEMRAFQFSQSMQNVALSMINSFDRYIYVCNPHTHKVLFINDKIKRSSDINVGDFCYSAFFHRDLPCEICPMKAFMESPTDVKSSREFYHTCFGIWINVNVSWIDWLNGEKVCLIEGMDIS